MTVCTTEKVNFIHIGFHRCGSTSLQTDVFSKSDGVLCVKGSALALNNKKSFSDVRWMENSKFKPDSVKLYGVSAEGLCGVDYCNSNEISKKFSSFPKEIYANWPSAKILIVFRRQPDLIRSYYSLALRKSQLDISLNDYADSFFVREYLAYDKLIKSYVDIFGRENVCALPAELLFYDTPTFLSRLSVFIDFDFTGAILGRRNSGDNRFALNIIRSLNAFLKKSNNDRTYQQLKHVILKMTSIMNIGGQQFLERETAETIRQYFELSNQEASTLTGFDLIGQYGY